MHQSWTLALQKRQGTLPDTQLLERLADVHALHGGQFERLDDYTAALSAYSEASKIAPHCQDYTFKRWRKACACGHGFNRYCLLSMGGVLKQNQCVSDGGFC